MTDTTDTAKLVTACQTIAATVQAWIDWSKKRRDEENFITDEDSAIMTLPVPTWPTHGTMANWVEALNQSATALASASKLWECPDCAFAFDAMHKDADGGYTCPCCALASSAALNERLIAFVRQLAKGEVIRGYEVIKAQALLADIEGKQK